MTLRVDRPVGAVPVILISRFAEHDCAGIVCPLVMPIDVIDLAPHLAVDPAQLMRGGKPPVSPHRR